MKFIARVISDGRVTIPEEIRKLLGIRCGDYISCEIENLHSPTAQTPLNPYTKTPMETESE